MATMEILDRLGATQVVEKPLPPGPAADTASRPVAFSTQDRALLTSLAAAVTALETTTALADSNNTIGFTKAKDASGNDLTYTKSSATTPPVFNLTTSPQLVIPALSTRMHAEVVNLHATIEAYWGQTSAICAAGGHAILPRSAHNFDGYTGDVYVRIASSTGQMTSEEY